MLGRGVCRVTHCAPAALRSDKRGKSDHEARVSCGTRATPRPVLLGTHRREPGGSDSLSGHRCARPGLRGAKRLRPAGPSAAMARPVSPPLWMRRGAQRAGWRVCRRTHPLRALACRSCLNGARQRAVSSAAHPAREHRRLPAAKRRDADSGVALSLVTFFRRSERKLPRRRARTPASALSTGKQHASQNAPKTIASSAVPISARAQKHTKRGTT